MRVHVVRVLFIAALLFPAPAIAGEKLLGNFHQPALYQRDACFVNMNYIVVPNSTTWVDGTSSGKFDWKSTSCKMKLYLKRMTDTGPLPVSDAIPGNGDEILCLIHMFDGGGGGGCESLLLRLDVTGANPLSRRAKTRPDLSVELPAAYCALPERRTVTHIECYEPDGGAYNLAAACAAAGGGAVTPFASDPSQGVCRSGELMPNPVTPLIAIWGLRMP